MQSKPSNHYKARRSAPKHTFLAKVRDDLASLTVHFRASNKEAARHSLGRKGFAIIEIRQLNPQEMAALRAERAERGRSYR